MLFALLALRLVPFYGPDNQVIEINPEEVVAIREPRENETTHHENVACVIYTSDGKFFGVREDCTTVAQRLTVAAPDKVPPPIEKQ